MRPVEARITYQNKLQLDVCNLYHSFGNDEATILILSSNK